MIECAAAAGYKAGDATGFSGDVNDYGDWGKMTEKQKAIAEKGIGIYREAFNTAKNKRAINDLLTGMGNFQKVITDKMKKAYQKGYQDGKAAAKGKAKKSVRLIEGRQYSKPVAQQAYDAGYATGQAGADEGFFTKMVNSLKAMYNKCLEYWHKFSVSENGRFIGYTFLCLGIVFCLAMIICLALNPDDMQKTRGLMSQFYAELNDSIAKAFKQGTLKGMITVLLAPFKIISGTFKAMGQTGMGRLWILTVVCMLIAAIVFYGERLKLNPKNNDAN